MNFLETIIEEKRREVEKRRSQKSFAQLHDEALKATGPLDFTGALQEGISIIAEVKRKSPSKGKLSVENNSEKLALLYEKNGASAVSVLTDRKHFGGSQKDLVAVRKAIRIPVLRKDFIIDPSQIFESRAIGADAVLLITAILDEGELKSMIGLTEELGMSALVEVHSEDELTIAVRCGAGLIGINNRDLTSFDVDLKTGVDLVSKVPSGVIAVAESGILTDFDITLLARAGFRVFLIGEALVTASDPGKTIKHLMRSAAEAAGGRVNAG